MEKESEKKRVLVIDDDEDVLAYLETWFADQGFLPETARDGNEAMEKLKAHTPDLITLDIVMPHKTGVKFYREIKKNKDFAKIPVIIITGLQAEFENFISHRRTAPPPEGYVSKPFDPQELLATVKKVVHPVKEQVCT